MPSLMERVLLGVVMLMTVSKTFLGQRVESLWIGFPPCLLPLHESAQEVSLQPRRWPSSQWNPLSSWFQPSSLQSHEQCVAVVFAHRVCSACVAGDGIWKVLTLSHSPPDAALELLNQLHIRNVKVDKRKGTGWGEAPRSLHTPCMLWNPNTGTLCIVSYRITQLWNSLHTRNLWESG